MILDPLENEESLVETLAMLGNIARCKYEESCSALVSIFNPIANQYQVSMVIMHDVSCRVFRELVVRALNLSYTLMCYVFMLYRS